MLYNRKKRLPIKIEKKKGRGSIIGRGRSFFFVETLVILLYIYFDFNTFHALEYGCQIINSWGS